MHELALGRSSSTRPEDGVGARIDQRPNDSRSKHKKAKSEHAKKTCTELSSEVCMQKRDPRTSSVIVGNTASSDRGESQFSGPTEKMMGARN